MPKNLSSKVSDMKPKTSTVKKAGGKPKIADAEKRFKKMTSGPGGANGS